MGHGRSGFSAIAAGVDLPQYARELARVHDAVLGGSTAGSAPRPVVSRSWSRVLASGLAPGAENARHPLPLTEIERRRRESPLALVVDELGQVIAAIADASHLLMVVADADGIILWRMGSARIRQRADQLGFLEGSEWTEQRVGTNAIGTALAEAAPVQLFSAEHFEQSQHPWYCTASPIHDPRTGELLGVVDVSGPALTLHPMINALVETAVRMAESQLWRHHEQRLERLRTASAPALASTRGPVLLVDEHGWVAHATGVSAADRIAVPRLGRALQIPGLGLCMPEPITDGWLIRATGDATRFLLTLDLSGEPAIEVSGADASWRSALPTRHAELLVLLHVRGTAGLTAAELSQAIYGDPDHVVTVRAEISRLRRTLGGVVESRPYRLAESVDLMVRLGAADQLADTPFVRRVASPGVRALATRF
ncbi:GAF domain-containing protein [Tomitella biformata]|uniref:GAF domain-containing protein n=1 Tax=Tomitella biformata TaxID=630403 RepID=UPI00046759CC|nr:GAF domain-containing protein [Tomitella biformata]